MIRCLYRTFFLTYFAVVLTSCGGTAVVGGLILPRGSTISVRTIEPISSAQQGAGASFGAVLSAPLADGTQIFVPVGAKLDGIVDGLSRTPDGLAQISVRVTRLYVPSGQSVEIQSASITRRATADVGDEGELRADQGIEDKIAYLAETGVAKPVASLDDNDTVALIPAGSTFVFTLIEDLVIPPPP